MPARTDALKSTTLTYPLKGEEAGNSRPFKGIIASFLHLCMSPSPHLSILSSPRRPIPASPHPPFSASPHLRISVSARRPIPASPRLPVPPSPRLPERGHSPSVPGISPIKMNLSLYVQTVGNTAFRQSGDHQFGGGLE
jgi:hypothetical protein